MIKQFFGKIKKKWIIYLAIFICLITTGIIIEKRFALFSLAADLTFGETGTGDTTLDTYTDYIWGTLATPASAGTVISISIYVQDGSYDAGPFKLGIYDASDNFVIGTNEITNPTVNQWNTYSVTVPTAITVQEYLIAFWNENISTRQDTNLPAYCRKMKAVAYPGTWPSPLTSYTEGCSSDISIYATYTPSAAPGTTAVMKADAILFGF